MKGHLSEASFSEARSLDEGNSSDFSSRRISTRSVSQEELVGHVAQLFRQSTPHSVRSGTTNATEPEYGDGSNNTSRQFGSMSSEAPFLISRQVGVNGQASESKKSLSMAAFAMRYNASHGRRSPCLCCIGVGAVMFVVLGAVVAGAVMENLKV